MSHDSGPSAAREISNPSRKTSRKFQSQSLFRAKRNLAAVMVALSLVTTLAPSGLALPVSTTESVDHAAALKSAPTVNVIPKELDGQIKKGKNSPYRGNMLEWNSANPKDAFIVCIHAWGLSAREFSSFGTEMSTRGFDVAALDVRGFGANRDQDGMKTIDLDKAIKDIGQLLAAKRKSDPKKKIFLVGESMGGAMALKTAALYPELVDGVVCSAPAWRIFSLKTITVKGVVDQVLGEPGFAARFITNKASSDEKLQKQWLSDSNYRMNYSAPEAFHYYRLMQSTPKNAKEIKGIPVLVMQGLNDHLSKPCASVKLFKKLKNKSKQLAIVLGGEHLVLEENQLKPLVASFVEDWVLNQMHDKKASNATPQMVVIGDPGTLDQEDQKELNRLKLLAGVRTPSPKARTTALKRDTLSP
ncbi:MAG: alpha/beta fold hydrolase [Candidatus Melainabacteria bacterium]|nr:alpha/beta fold hydrolase [Candidatus Melainabacteria bacterium]